MLRSASASLSATFSRHWAAVKSIAGTYQQPQGAAGQNRPPRQFLRGLGRFPGACLRRDGGDRLLSNFGTSFIADSFCDGSPGRSAARPAPKGALSATGSPSSRGRRGVGVRSSHTTMERIFVAIIISALLLLLGVPGLILVRQAEMHHADLEELRYR